MQINTKFNIGDKVVYQYEYEVTEFITCPTCQGSTKLTAVVSGRTVPVECPKCEDGKQRKLSKKTFTERFTITGLRVEKPSYFGDEIHYTFDRRCQHDPHSNIFPESKITYDVNPTGQAGSSQWELGR